MHTAFIGLGSNLGNPEKTCAQAIEALRNYPQINVERVSSLYRTEPMGLTDQDWFINAVVQCGTTLTVDALLEATSHIEQSFGRVRSKRWEPRTLDLDILFYDNLCRESSSLTVPHPRIQERRFVLVPLVEIAPQWLHPLLGKTVEQLLSVSTAEGQVVERMETP
jgi:2-amino-4-hydroxy-6-hydroxymethyldihydropteridine diphosphokinase